MIRDVDDILAVMADVVRLSSLGLSIAATPNISIRLVLDRARELGLFEEQGL